MEFHWQNADGPTLNAGCVSDPISINITYIFVIFQGCLDPLHPKPSVSVHDLLYLIKKRNIISQYSLLIYQKYHKLLVSVFCLSSSWCHRLVCALVSWHFLVICTCFTIKIVSNQMMVLCFCLVWSQSTAMVMSPNHTFSSRQA